MKRLIKVEEIEGEGLEALLDEAVMIYCMNYIYAGKLTGVNETFVQLSDAALVYETGPYNQIGFKDAQNLPGGVWYIQRSSIESFGRGK